MNRRLRNLTLGPTLSTFMLQPLLYDDPEGGGGGSGDEWKPPTSKEEEAARIDKVVQARLARKGKKSGAAGDGGDGDITAEDRAELERLRKAEKERDRAEKEAKGQYDAALESVRKEHSTKEGQWKKSEAGLLSELTKERCENQVLAIVGPLVHNPAHVARELKDRINLDPKTKLPRVVDEDGQPMFKDGAPYPIKDFVLEFLEQDENKYMLKSTAAGEGTGGEKDTTGASDKGRDVGLGGKGAQSKEIEKLETEWKELQKVALTSGQPGDVTASHQAKRKLDEARAAVAKK